MALIFLLHNVKMTSLAERAVRAREDAKLKPAEAARRIGIRQPSLWAIEHGKTKTIKGATLLKMARVYSVNEKWLGEGVGTMKASVEKTSETLRADAEQLARDWLSLPPEMRETVASAVRDMVHLASRLRITKAVPDADVAKHIAPAPTPPQHAKKKP